MKMEKLSKQEMRAIRFCENSMVSGDKLEIDFANMKLNIERTNEGTFKVLVARKQDGKVVYKSVCVDNSEKFKRVQ